MPRLTPSSKTKDFARNWWSQRFIEAIEQFTDSGRLSRGRSYARGNKVESFEIRDGVVSAKVWGSVNPYFGVYKKPLYVTTLEFPGISPQQWEQAIALIASNAGCLSQLMLQEMPQNIEEPFAALGLHLLPTQRNDLNTHCSCPDYSNPCKHIAGVYYLLAAQLDRDPYLLFELRGMPRDRFQAALEQTSLGKSLAQTMDQAEIVPIPVESYYPQPQTVAVAQPLSRSIAPGDLRAFWLGSQPSQLEPTPPPTSVSGILVKKQGDQPAFWEGQASFLEVMDELYRRVKTDNSKLL